jgi:hypothetical protein
VKSAGKLQTMLTWAEDRALLRSTPSADPGAKTGARAEHTSALRSLVDRSARQLRDWHQCDKPSRHDAATSRPRCHSPFIYANRTKFHFTVNQDSLDRTSRPVVLRSRLYYEAEPRCSVGHSPRPSEWHPPLKEAFPDECILT